MIQKSPDYGWHGRLGIGTPQANPTVEAEMRRLIPQSVEYFTLRMTSDSGDAKTRVLDYFELLPSYVKRYATLNIDGFLVACTGSSYLLGDERSHALAEEASQHIHAPVILAADAIKTMLQDANATRVALLSPYPDWLNNPALTYWTDAGFDIVAKAQVDIGSDNTDQIYEQQSTHAEAMLGAFDDVDVDAFLVSGTGMPSLPIVKKLRAEGKTVVTSNLALAVAGLKLLGQTPTPDASWAFGS